MTFADWVVSSRAWTTQAISIDGLLHDVTAPNGGLYLVHPNPALSLLARLVEALDAAGVPEPSAHITEQRFVRIEAASSFVLVWGIATELRDLLGFTGTLAGSSSYTAPLRSTLLWSPGKTFAPEIAPLDAHGQPVVDASVTSGPAGRIVVRHHGEPSVVNVFSARYVEKSRFWASPPGYGPGEWRHFWEHECWTAQRMIVLRRVVEGSSATASAGYSSSLALGPYRADLTARDFRALPFSRDAGFERVEAYYPVSLPVVQTVEFT